MQTATGAETQFIPNVMLVAMVRVYHNMPHGEM